MEIVDGLEIEHRLAEPTDEQDITHLGDEAKAKELPEDIMVILRVIEGQEVGKGYPVPKVPVTLGRDALCDISITDTRMSRQHSMLFYYSPNFYLKDLGSTNGTFVNDKRIKQATIKNEDIIKVGSTKMEFIVSTSGSAAGS
jgi:pSer/pThr/pTyr-binding forkhead associated (FHA) protein